MKDTDIDSFLRSNKPQVKEDPAFLLEVQQKMHAVEGIKTEVDRQRRFGRTALLATLMIGLVCGIAITLLAYIYPIDPESISEGIISRSRVFIDTWKHYLVIPVLGCAAGLWHLWGNAQKATDRF